jgi:PAS domain S-box-containing protein
MTETLQRIGAELITTFNVSGLMDILFNDLPKIGIPVGYLALYENPLVPKEWARLLLAYNEKGRIELEPGGERFPSSQIIPHRFLPENRRITLILQALYFHKEQIGFLLLDAEQREPSVYEILRRDISSALFGAILIKKVQENAAEIARQKYILDTFMETVPDRIYFKDREGRITRANHAHAKRLGLKNPSEEVGKTDYDFFPTEVARKKREYEEEVLNSGYPLLAIEEQGQNAAGHPDWSLTTKMPLRDENGQIIGIFGISRDITELKQAQQALENANQKITKLNDNLTDENQRMHTEMELARRIQTALLPKLVKNVHPDFEIAALMLPAEEVGGDYYDISLDRENGLWLSIGDVSGHGVTPGLIMMMAQTVHTTITTNYHASALDAVININKVLIKNVYERLGEDHFMTFTTLKYLGAGSFEYAGKHLDLVLYRQRTKTCERVETTGLYLNCITDLTSCTKNDKFIMEKGDLLVLYTDGLTEAANNNTQKREMIKLSGLMEIVQKYGEQEVEVCRDAIIKDVLHWSGGKQEDDMSLVVVRRIR